MSTLTLKGAKALYDSLGATIQELELSVDKTFSGLSKLNELGVTDPLVLNYNYAQLYLFYIYLDVCAALRFYLSGVTSYEERFAMKQLYTILNEGYKRLYGFDNKMSDSNIRKPQKNSVWNKFVSCYSQCGISEIEKAYKECLIVSEKFYDSIIFDKTARCHGAHYNEDYAEIYDFLKNLNAEIITQGAVNFLSFMDEWRKMFVKIGDSITYLVVSQTYIPKSDR